MKKGILNRYSNINGFFRLQMRALHWLYRLNLHRYTFGCVVNHPSSRAVVMMTALLNAIQTVTISRMRMHNEQYSVIWSPHAKVIHSESSRNRSFVRKEKALHQFKRIILQHKEIKQSQLDLCGSKYLIDSIINTLFYNRTQMLVGWLKGANQKSTKWKSKKKTIIQFSIWT